MSASDMRVNINKIPGIATLTRATNYDQDALADPDRLWRRGHRSDKRYRIGEFSITAAHDAAVCAARRPPPPASRPAPAAFPTARPDPTRHSARRPAAWRAAVARARIVAALADHHAMHQIGRQAVRRRMTRDHRIERAVVGRRARGT